MPGSAAGEVSHGTEKLHDSRMTEVKQGTITTHNARYEPSALMDDPRSVALQDPQATSPLVIGVRRAFAREANDVRLPSVTAGVAAWSALAGYRRPGLRGLASSCGVSAACPPEPWLPALAASRRRSRKSGRLSSPQDPHGQYSPE